MRLARIIKAILGLDFDAQSRAEIRREENEAVRKVAERYSRGSVGIQRGAFQTREDLDRELEKVGLPPPNRDSASPDL